MDDEAEKALLKILGEQARINIRMLNLLAQTAPDNEENKERLLEMADAVADIVPEYVRLTRALRENRDGD